MSYERDRIVPNIINDSSQVFKVTTPDKSVLFLGDIGPDGGDVLYRESRHLLKADIAQMAHHGHMNCSMEIYAAIMPEAYTYVRNKDYKRLDGNSWSKNPLCNKGRHT